MYKFNPSLVDLEEQDKEIYDKFCFMFYKTFLYSKEGFNKLTNELKSYSVKYNNDKDKYLKITLDLNNFFYSNCDIEPRLNNVLIITKLIKHIVILYKKDNKFFDKCYLSGKRNFLYYIELNCAKYLVRDEKELEIIKQEIKTTEQEMVKFRKTVLNGPEKN